MANTSTKDYYSDKDSPILLFMPTSKCQTISSDTSGFNQWWEDETNKIGQYVKAGKLPFQTAQEYPGDMILEQKIDAIPGLRELIEEADSLSHLEEDWNEDGASAIAESSIRQAQTFLKQLACSVRDYTVNLMLPSVYPTIEGGVQLYWNQRSQQVILTFRPQKAHIELQYKKIGEDTINDLLLVQDAAPKVLSVLYNA